MKFSENALTVLKRRYLAKDAQGNLIEDVEGMFRRVAGHIAKADLNYDKQADVAAVAEEFYQVMTQTKFMPNSPTLMNAGRPLGQLAACFVLPVGDSMGEIFDAIKNAALIHQSGGGTGFSFSRLRRAGATVRSTGGVASGPVSFMKVFNAATEAVKQGGTRRGANMGILRVDHPDILDFIKCKQDTSEITNFNISVGLTDAFMRALERGEEYALIDPSTKETVRMQRAGEVFDLIVEMAWQTGEPGIVFLDRMNEDNPVPALGDIESTNPCGEQPLLPYESCNLGSINLNAVLSERNGKYTLDLDELGRVVDTAVHFLDNVIDMNEYPLPQIADMSRSTRKIGLGVMGFADMLYKLGIPYDSEKGIETAEIVMKYIDDRSKQASMHLAQTRGAFPAFSRSALADSTPLRNATTTTIAPTGTISILCSASSGVEPLFALAFKRNVMDNDTLVEVNPFFREVAEAEGFYSEELMQKIAEHGTVRGIDGVPEQAQRVFVTAHDINPEYHIRMQAAFQKYVDNAVSKTVNFPTSATREDVRKVFMLANSLQCKGVTIYRDGSRDAQVLSVGEKKQEAPVSEPAPVVQTVVRPRPRPDVTRGYTEKVRIGCGNLYVTVNYDEQGICEVFANLGRAGGCPSQSEATSRLISMALRSGMDVPTIVEQLRGIRCHSTLRQQGLTVLSCPDAIGRVIEKVYAMQQREQAGVPADWKELGSKPATKDLVCLGNCSMCNHRDHCTNPNMTGLDPSGRCPECGEKLEHEGGCAVCRACGYSKCG
ncbi:MAG: vitamin B12-dependent ribonucleotide reductase [Clostridia bacterium]|nr:vitamin B12-dependent ribonucleotide reductase [Clostridia bacterium]